MERTGFSARPAKCHCAVDRVRRSVYQRFETRSDSVPESNLGFCPQCVNAGSQVGLGGLNRLEFFRGEEENWDSGLRRLQAERAPRRPDPLIVDRGRSLGILRVEFVTEFVLITRPLPARR